MVRERDAMVAAVAVLPWLKPMPSDANYVLFEVLAPADAATVVASLRRRGVLIRYYPSGPLAGYIRISAGRPQDTAGLLAVLHDLHVSFGLPPVGLSSVGAGAGAGTGASVGPGVVVSAAPPSAPRPKTYNVVLFDMDGVLVNVAGSYRAAIVNTAARWGVSVTGEDIEAVKARGNANNDWALTLTLITEAAASGAASVPTIPSLEAVTEAFEELYQGTGVCTGCVRVLWVGVLCALSVWPVWSQPWG
jgi:hypothetical protein